MISIIVPTCTLGAFTDPTSVWLLRYSMSQTEHKRAACITSRYHKEGLLQYICPSGRLLPDKSHHMGGTRGLPTVLRAEGSRLHISAKQLYGILVNGSAGTKNMWERVTGSVQSAAKASLDHYPSLAPYMTQ